MPTDTDALTNEQEVLALTGFEWARRRVNETVHLVTRFRVAGDDAVTSWCDRPGAWEAVANDDGLDLRCATCASWLERQVDRRVARADEYEGVLQLDPDVG